MRTLSLPSIRTGVLVMWCLLMPFLTKATTYYSRTNNGFWNDPLTWSTVGYGNATNTATYPKKGDLVLIGDGYTIVMNLNAVCAGITVGQGTSGALEYSSFLAFTLTVAGSVTINNGAHLSVPGNNSKQHNLFISGSLTNNGSVDLYQDADDYVNLVFNSAVNSTVIGAGTWDLNKVTVFKSTLTSYRLDVQVNAFENAIRQLVVTYGTYHHDNTGTYNVNAGAGAFTVDPNAIFKVSQGILSLSPLTPYCYLQGGLQVTGGTLKIGQSTGTGGLRYDQNGTIVPFVTVTSGTLTVYGGITYRSGSSTEPFSFNMSGGDVLLNSGTTGTTNELLKVTSVASSNFTMSGGVITLEKPNVTGATVADFDLNGTAGTVGCTGGTVQFGDASTASGLTFNFVPYSGIVQPNFKVTGPAANAITLRPSQGATSDFSIISLYIDVNKTFDNRSISGTTGDTRTMTITDNYDGFTSLYNDGTFTPRTGTVAFQGLEGLWINGSATVTFYKLTINNPLGVSLGKSVNVSNTLSLNNGVLYSSAANIITCQTGATANIGSALSYVDGPFAQRIANTLSNTVNLPIGKNGAYRPIILSVRHTNATTITYTAEAWNSSARTFGYTLPGTLSWVSDVRYYTINRTNVANINTARLTLSYGADDVVNDYANLRVARWNGTTSWLDIGGSGTANGSGSIQSGAFNAFNQKFALGNTTGGSNPLPVELVSFTAQKNGSKVTLQWATASEKNSDHFEIERSRNGSDFESIALVQAVRTSNNIRNYIQDDMNPLLGLSYYRLKEVDMDGKIQYSDIRTVNYGRTANTNLYPNPATSEGFSMNLQDVSGEYSIEIFDITGKAVYSEYGEAADVSAIHIRPSGIVPGTYFVRLQDGSGLNRTEKLLRTNRY